MSGKHVQGTEHSLSHKKPRLAVIGQASCTRKEHLFWACMNVQNVKHIRIRIRLHLFQPHQADQMPGCHWTSQFHKRTSCLNMHE